jgi:predicted dithiol-disulfide oxidoreductase (DUF899 family)
VRLSELFAPGKDSLVIYSFMFPRDPATSGRGRRPARRPLPLTEGPCPSCVALLDQLDGAAEHAASIINFAVVAKAPIDRRLAFARSAAGAAAAAVLGEATPTTATTSPRQPRAGSGRCSTCSTATATTIRHFWGSELFYAPTEPGQDPRHVGTLEPLWNLFDLTPQGRPADWDEQGLSVRAPAPASGGLPDLPACAQPTER